MTDPASLWLSRRLRIYARTFLSRRYSRAMICAPWESLAANFFLDLPSSPATQTGTRTMRYGARPHAMRYGAETEERWERCETRSAPPPERAPGHANQRSQCRIDRLLIGKVPRHIW